MNRPTVMASFNVIMGQMTEMSLRKKPVTMMLLRLESPSGKSAKASHCGWEITCCDHSIAACSRHLRIIGAILIALLVRGALRIQHRAHRAVAIIASLLSWKVAHLFPGEVDAKCWLLRHKHCVLILQFSRNSSEPNVRNVRWNVSHSRSLGRFLIWLSRQQRTHHLFLIDVQKRVSRYFGDLCFRIQLLFSASGVCSFDRW